MFAVQLVAEPSTWRRRAARRGIVEDLVEDLQRTTPSTMKFSEIDLEPSTVALRVRMCWLNAAGASRCRYRNRVKPVKRCRIISAMTMGRLCGHPTSSNKHGTTIPSACWYCIRRYLCSCSYLCSVVAGFAATLALTAFFPLAVVLALVVVSANWPQLDRVVPSGGLVRWLAAYVRETAPSSDPHGRAANNAFVDLFITPPPLGVGLVLRFRFRTWQ